MASGSSSMSSSSATASKASKNIHESIRLVLGKQTKILLKVPVKQEFRGGDKTESRILVFTPHRLFVLTARVPTKIEHHVHYLDFRRVDVPRTNVISFAFVSDKSPHTFRVDDTSSVGEILMTLVAAVGRVYPGVPVTHIVGPVELAKDSVHPAAAEAVRWKPPDPKAVGPCGGFSTQYASSCDYFGAQIREEVAWDVDTIYFSHDTREMCLQDFDHLDLRDQICIVAALEHNAWFTKLRASGNAKLAPELGDRILGVVAKSVSLQELHVPGVGARWDFAQRFGQALSSNPHCTLTSIDASCNLLEDKGVAPLAAAISKLAKGMHHLNLSYCSLTGKGVGGLMQALTSNRSTAATLTYLNLAGNSMKEDSCTQLLCNFLAQPNVVAILDVSSTETPLDVLFGALLRGCTTALTHLNLSRNPFSASKKAKETPTAFKQFFAGTLALQYINVSHCRLPPEALKHLLLGLACNESTANVELNLSNNQLGAAGAAVIESCIGGVRCVTRLDLSENGIESEMAGVMQGIARNRSVLSLNVSRNMTGVKPKHMPSVVDGIVHLIQDEETVVQKLNLSDCKLRSEVNNVINALGSNQSLLHLDISGNAMGDVGARLLAKALQINTRLRTLNLDRNGISIQGYADITYALSSNYALRHIPFPTFDLQPFIKAQPERVDAVLHRMQELLQRNSTPQRLRSAAQAFRLTQGFLLSSTQQILDRVAASAQDNVDAVRKVRPAVVKGCEDDDDDDRDADLRVAQELIGEAENSKHLLSSLHENAAARAAEVDAKLKHVAGDLGQFVVDHVSANLDAMIGCADRQCPRVMDQKDGRFRTDILLSCKRKCQISPDFVAALVTDQVGLEVHNKINELNLIIANYISDRVIDEVIENVTLAGKALSADLAGGNFKKKRSLTPDVLKPGSSASVRSASASESLEQETVSMTTGSEKSEYSPMNTPQTSKRKSIQGRKLRPKSVVDANAAAPLAAGGGGLRTDCLYDVEENSSANSPSAEIAGSRSPDSQSSSGLDRVPDLPSSTALQHLGKARPKRTKRHAPSRGAVVAFNRSLLGSTAGTDGTGGSGTAADDGGVDKFYPTCTPTSADASMTSTPSVDSPVVPDVSSSPVPSSSSAGGIGGMIISHLKSPKSRNASKEDLFSSSAAAPGAKDEDQQKAVPHVVPSPSSLTSNVKQGRSGSSGLSCLASYTTDEDSPPPPAMSSVLKGPLGISSPDRKISNPLSPTVQSISDIFSRQTSSGKLTGMRKTRRVSGESGGAVEPQKPDNEGHESPFGGKPTISNDNSNASASNQDQGLISASGGARTPDGVLKRQQGVGYGTELMAEMKEKRASLLPAKSSGAEDDQGGTPAPPAPASVAKPAAAEEAKSLSAGSAGNASGGSVFGKVKLRSTGLAGSLTSPSAEFPTTPVLAKAATIAASVTTNALDQAATTIDLLPTVAIAASNSSSLSSSSSIKGSSETSAKIASSGNSSGGGSIVGLRAAKFSSPIPSTVATSAPSASSAINTTPVSSITPGKSPEIKPRALAATLSSTSNANCAAAVPSSSSPSSAGRDTSPVGHGLRPKPLPKPRPWSIVGVDRKSGEITSVGTGGDGGSPPPPSGKVPSNPTAASSMIREGVSAGNAPAKLRHGGAPSSGSSNRSSVRDLINNMNRNSTSGSPSASTAGQQQQPHPESPPESIGGFGKRKSGSLPRGLQPPLPSVGGSSGVSVVAETARKFSTGSNSPGPAKRAGAGASSSGAAGSTNDDPRILRLDDDFGYDYVMDV